MKKILVLLFVLALAAPASAYFIDFDGPIPAGVTVEYFDGGLVPGVAVLPVPNGVPLSIFSPSAIPGGGDALLLYDIDAIPSFGPYGVLVTYSVLQRFVSAVGNDFGGDAVLDNEVAYLSAFDSAGTFLGSASFSSAYAVPNLKPVAFESLSDNIKYVAFTWTTDLGFYLVDNINNCPCPPVPVPGTLVLLGSALVGLVGMGLRKV